MAESRICEDFSQIFHISKPIENDTNLPHPKFSRLCPKARFYSQEFGVRKVQEKRREEHMENIRRKRDNLLASLRKLVSLTEDDCSVPPYILLNESKDDVYFKKENNTLDIEMETISVERTSSKKSKKNKDSFEKLISKQLMLSEWLVDVPEDFYNEWLMVSCPNGRRCIVIAAKGETKVYLRNGHLMTRFQSLIPGGSKKNILKSKKSSILDCIFVEQDHKFWILDVISWNGCSFYHCDTEFRFFWVRMKFEDEVRYEQKEALMIQDDSKMDFNSTYDSCSKIINASVSRFYSFEPLQYFDCTKENIMKLLNDKGSHSQIDGVLFFNKHSLYTPGVTPLVCWLKISMFQDILKL